MMRTRRLLLWGLVILIIGRLCYWTEPYGVSVDESTYMAIAETIQNGGVLYESAVDRKPPALFFFYAGLGLIFGPWNIHALHIVFLFIFLGIGLGLRQLSRRLTNDITSPDIVFFSFCLFSACFPREILSSNAEMLMVLSLIIGLLFYPRHCFLAGIFFSLSVFFKQYSVLIFGPFLLVHDVLRRGAFRREWLLTLGGGLAGALPFVIYFYAHHAFDAFMHYTFFDGVQYVAGPRADDGRAPSGLLATLGMLAAWLPLWIGLARTLRLSRNTHSSLNAKEILPWLAVILGSAVTIYLSGRYYTHYFFPLVAFLSLLGGLGLSLLKQGPLKPVLMALSLFIFVGFSFFNVQRDRFMSHSFTRQKQQLMQDLSVWIQQESEPTDRIVVWGMASQIYTMSERGSGTRFIFADFVAGRQPGLHSATAAPSPGTEAQFISDLRNNRPRYIIDTSPAKLNDYQWFPLSRNPSLYSEVQATYRRRELELPFEVWERLP